MFQKKILKNQEQIWSLSNLMSGKGAFTIANTYLIEGEIDTVLLEKAINVISNTFTVLKLQFNSEDGKANSIYDKETATKSFLDIVKINSGYVKNEDDAELIKELNRPISVSSKRLTRTTLFSFTNQKSILCFMFHNIIVDKQSARFISQEVGRIYSMLVEEQIVSELSDDKNYFELINRINSDLLTEANSKKSATWLADFPNPNEKINLPIDYSNKVGRDFSGCRKALEIDNELLQSIDNLLSTFKVEKEVLFLAAYAILLHRLSNQDSIVFGVPKRLIKDSIETSIGNFENVLPVKIDFSSSPNLNDILKQLNDNLAFNEEFSVIPYTSLIENNHQKKELTLNTFYQSRCSFSEGFTPKFGGCNTKEVYVDRRGARLDLSFEIIQNKEGYNLIAEYNTNLFSNESIERWGQIYQLILNKVISDPSLPSDEIELIIDEDKNRLVDWNNTQKPYEESACIHHKLENWAKKSHTDVALYWKDERITYYDLNARANQLANFISSKKDLKSSIIAICMDRSPEMMASLFAILKCGATYLPLDPSAPAERTKTILEDAKPELILLGSELKDKIPAGSYAVYEIDKLSSELSNQPEDNLNLDIKGHDQAYIIYTSGSTGIPKGVIIEHHSVLNRIAWMQEKYPISTEDILIQKTPITFDVSVWELFWWSFEGAAILILPPGHEKEPDKILQAIEQYNVSIIHFVPSMFSAFIAYLDAFQEQDKLKTLKHIFLSGEALPAQTVNEFYDITKIQNNTTLVNLYGPTEATVDVSYYTCEQSIRHRKIYIGKPIHNTQLWVVNRKNKLQPIGVPGELLISGVNLAKGYLNRPELNKEKFIHTLVLNKNVRAYKTGDIAKWTEVGEIEYIGRIDNQVKIRGFRIELGEIEAKIKEYSTIETCATVVNRDNVHNPILVAYIKPLGDTNIETDEIKTFLTDRLPSYMVPTSFIRVKKMPLTSSGKINRKALPKIKETHQTSVPVNGNIEGIILNIWQDVLKNTNIDNSDNFFDIGGNSIMIPHIVSKLIKGHNIKIDTMDIFQYPTVEALSSFIHKRMGIDSSKTLNKKASDSINKQTNKKTNHSIAIVGIAGKFPEADSVDEFWKNLCDGKESLQFFTDEQLRKTDASYEKNKDNPNYIRSRGILNKIEEWDAKFFGYSPHDAKHTDPQQRLWFETVWNALEDSGTDPYTYKGDIGVFAGVNLNSYLFDNILRKREIYEDYMHFSNAETFHTYVNNDPAFVATRTAYLFNLRGPAINVQTACSTSLTAITQACDSLVLGRSDMAIAGASSIQTPQEIGYVYQPGSMRSEDGHCRPFDKDASGTVFSNAIGTVILKRLDDAIEDNDKIYGVIKGWAINNDGNDKIGFAAPSINGQLELLRKAQKHANIHPEDIGYIETHGTGTKLGDPIEASALTQAFREKTEKKQFCGLGSVKGNFGHTDVAAGIVGLIKATLSVYHKKIPATINFTSPNPNIDFENSPFFVIDRDVKWPDNKPLIIGISALGVGGTNAHVILEDFKKKAKKAEVETKPQILTVSAKSQNSLDTNIKNLVNHIEKKSSDIIISDLAYTTQLRRSHFQNKAFAVISNNKKVTVDDFKLGAHTNQNKKIVFLFPGQGAQFENMGIELYKNCAVFKEHLDTGFEIYKATTGQDLKKIIFTDKPENGALLNNTEFTQPALFITSYATAKLYEFYGIVPNETIGHSIGEYVSACLAGVFDFETALKIVIKRGQLMQSVPKGSMMAVRTDENTLSRIKLDKFEIAAINAPQSCTICYKNKDEKSIIELLEKNSIEYILLNTSHAFHSSQFDIILDEFRAYVNTFTLNQPILPFISCPTGNYASKSDITTANYWAKQLRHTVYFNNGIGKLHAGVSDCIFVEVGPNTHLSSLTRQSDHITKKTKIISSIGRNPDSNTYQSFLSSLGNIWLAGVMPDFSKFYGENVPELIKLPQYAFDKKRYWIDIDHGKIAANIDGDFNAAIIKPAEIDEEKPLQKHTTSNLSTTQKGLLNIWAKELGTNDISIEDNFFEHGGHSLLAIQIINRIKEKFNIVVTVKSFLDNPTIDNLEKQILNAEGKQVSQKIELQHTNNTTKLPLTDTQKRIWIAAILNTKSPAYNIPLTLLLTGRPNESIFEKTLQVLFERHHTMYSVFRQENNEPYLELQPNQEIIINKVDLSTFEEGSKQNQLNKIISEDARKPFDLENDPLFRIHFIKYNPNKYYFYINIHHLIFDGLSLSVFIADFNEIYNAITKNADIPLKKISFQQYDYAIWERQNKDLLDNTEHINFWKTNLDGLPPKTNFPYDFPRPKTPSGYGAKEAIVISSEITQQLNEFSKKAGVTLFNTVLASFSLLIHRYSNDNDFCIGCPVSNRPTKELESIFGMFVNTILLRFNLKDVPNFKSLLENTKEIALNAISHQDLPFEKIVEVVNAERYLDYNPLFQIAFAWQKPMDNHLETVDFKGQNSVVENGISPFDITIYLWEENGQIEGEIEYNVDLLKKETIKRLKDNFLNIINNILISDDDISLSQIPLISDKEFSLIKSFNDTSTNYPKDKSIVDLFKQQVEKHGNSIAISYHGASITYNDLEFKSNQLACKISELRNTPNEPIGLMIPKSNEMIIAMLAILKSGSPYLPFDPDYPKDRIEYMINDAQCKVIVILGQDVNLLPNDIVKIDIRNDEAFSSTHTISNTPLKSDDTAYVMYTSGTTGKPKGSLIMHKSVVRLVKNTNYINLTHEDKILLTGASVFDASTFEIWGALLNGGELYIVDKEVILSPESLGEELETNKITTLWLTSPLFTLIAGIRTDIFSNLKNLLVGGDVLSPSHISKVFRENPNLQIINGYGPTENTTFSTCYKIDKEFKENIPIGKPISNSIALILDKNMKPIPIGVIGELYVGGDGLSKGYLNRPSLNDTKFVTHHESGQRLFRTGDYARWLSSGNIEFHGRIDNQLKIRGFRVELEEIENTLMEIKDIKEAVVKVYNVEPTIVRLVAFVHSSRTIDDKEIYNFIENKLPQYMVPDAIVYMDELPKTVNGKVDKNKLLFDINELNKTSEPEVEEMSPTESRVRNIWLQTLKSKQFGLNDNFFNVGGNSLLLLSVVDKIEKDLKVKLELRLFFENPTIRELSKLIGENIELNSSINSNPIKKKGLFARIFRGVM